MAISSSFASRLVLGIAPVLLLSFVFSISTSYAAQVHLPLYDGPRMRAVRSSGNALLRLKWEIPNILVLELQQRHIALAGIKTNILKRKRKDVH